MTVKREIHCCDFCGRDTANKSRICRHCTGGFKHNREHAGANMTPLTLWYDEIDSDFSEDSLGPKLAEDRVGGVWLDEDGEEMGEWKKVE